LFDARPFLLEGVNWDTIGFWQILSAVKEQSCPRGIVYAEPRSFDRGFLFLWTNSPEGTALTAQTFVPLDPDFARKSRESFALQGLMKHLGAEMVSIEPGACIIRVNFREELSQQHGYFHAGVTGAIADSASGYAAYSLMPAGSNVLTVEYKLNLVAPAHGDSLVARAQVVRAGRTLTVCRADVFAFRSGVEKICATSLSTIMTLAATQTRPEG
jgi:uncharacterized protein (TIGR00369 family)